MSVSRPERRSRAMPDEGRPGRRWNWDRTLSVIMRRIGKVEPKVAAWSVRRAFKSAAADVARADATGCTFADSYFRVDGGADTDGVDDGATGTERIWPSMVAGKVGKERMERGRGRRIGGNFVDVGWSNEWHDNDCQAGRQDDRTFTLS